MFESVQELPVALGAPHVSAAKSHILLAHQISIFMNFGLDKRGWVAPLGVMPTVEWANAHVRIPEVLARLSNEFGFNEFTSSEIHNVLRQYVRFVSRAKRYLADAQADNAFLHFIIALDLLFGEKQQSTATVTTRVAALVHRHFQVSYKDQVDRIRRLYDMRSRYVHSGISVDEQKISELKDICTAVLEYLLRFQCRAEGTSFSQWQKDIDFLASALEAGRPGDPAVMQELGLAG